jgi:hypothetical protein
MRALNLGGSDALTRDAHQPWKKGHDEENTAGQADKKQNRENIAHQDLNNCFGHGMCPPFDYGMNCEEIYCMMLTPLSDRIAYPFCWRVIQSNSIALHFFCLPLI